MVCLCISFESVMELLWRGAQGPKVKGLDLLGVLPRLARRGAGGGGMISILMELFLPAFATRRGRGCRHPVGPYRYSGSDYSTPGSCIIAFVLEQLPPVYKIMTWRACSLWYPCGLSVGEGMKRSPPPPTGWYSWYSSHGRVMNPARKSSNYPKIWRLLTQPLTVWGEGGRRGRGDDRKVAEAILNIWTKIRNFRELFDHKQYE